MYTKKIYFSGGDFHELQEVFRELPGIVETKTGYINAEENADFENVKNGKLKGYMGIEIKFNPKKTDISKLMDMFFAVVNPYLPDGQGKARGEMYRAGVFFSDFEDVPQIEMHMNFIANRGKPPAATSAGITMNDPNSNPKLSRRCYAKAYSLESFQEAEEEHQNYFGTHELKDTCIDFKKLREYVKF